MRTRRDPWKWPVAVGLAFWLLWAVVFVMPRSWLDFLLAPQRTVARAPATASAPVLHLLPPLVVEIEPTVTRPPKVSPSPPVPAADPRWWTEGWAVRTVGDEALFPAVSTTSDTVGVVLQALGLGSDFMTQARPDSVMAERLHLLQVEDGFRYDELKPYLSGMARARAYADILSRAADMYDEPLDRTIQVPD